MRKNTFTNIFFILIGIILDSLGTAVFLLPHGFIAGGLTGIGITINHYTHISIPLIVGFFSIILLAVGFFTLGKKFALSIIAGSFLFPLFLAVFQKLNLGKIVEDPLLSAIYAGLIIGLGLGLIIRSGASSGGSDVLPIILSRKFDWDVAPLLYITDIFIMALQLPFSHVEDVLLGILISLIISLTMHKIIIASQQNIEFTIISHKYMEINYVLRNNLDLGTTLAYAETGHLARPIRVIICTAPHERVHKVKDAVLSIDPEAFMTMVDAGSVKGRGFSLAKKY
jgi:uncharacterized membrane-anchored protein YitT (DUF2179 family)